MPLIWNGNYYVQVDGPTWLEAQANAESLGGNLVVITSAEENSAITQLLGDLNIYNSAFIGFQNSSWITGESFVYNNFTNTIKSNQSYYFNQDPYAEIFAPGVEDIRAPWQTDIVEGAWSTAQNNQGRDQKGIAEVPLSYFSVSDLTITEGDSGNITISRTGGSNTVQNLTLASRMEQR